MPKELTHWIIAEQSYKKLNSDSRLYRIIDRYQKEYLAGAVLPDTLLHLFRGPHAKSALSAAGQFHNADGNSYEPLIFAESQQGKLFSDPVLSCLLGVLSHMQADIVFHPYIYALTGIDDIGRHYQLETDIDMYVTSKCFQPPVYKLYDLITEETEPTIVSTAEMLYSTASELPRSAISTSLKLHCCFQSMYSNLLWKLAANLLGTILGRPYSQQRHLFYPIELLGKKDFNRIGKVFEWKHPVTGESNKSTIKDLIEDAVACIVEVFRRIEVDNSLAAALADPPGRNLLTGMYAVNDSKMFNIK